MTVVYTDGACSGNPGPGGWAWAVAPEGRPSASGGETHTTNQRMELTAVLEALRALPRPITVVSDSIYVINCFRDKWYVRWQANGWRNSKKQPVANADLWRPLVELVVAGDVEFRWVKGHSGDRLNDLADQLAVAAISWFELAWLAAHERIIVTIPVRSWLERLADGLQTLGVTPAVAAAAVSLPSSFPGDPADRLVYATAVEHGCLLVTKDRRLRNHRHPRPVTVW